jgi:tetratricopeptide (TPR) repeat protein
VPEQPPIYWAFLSYSSHDRDSAIWLQRALETYSVPRRLVGRSTPAGPAPRRFRPIFRDRTELAASADLVARIANALAQSAYLIVVCSPNAAKSHWVDDEVERFRALHGDARILTVLVGGTPESDHQDYFPPALRYRDAAQSRAERLEPIAADLRPGGDGRRMVRFKLLAGMLGVGLDELVRRDAQRRHRQLMVITAASLVGLVITGALATAALIARNDARRQRAHAEGLIEFMLTDLRKKLEPAGRLDAMDGVGREALKYYEAQSPADLDAQSLARRARALRLMGEIRVQRGDLGQALEGFEQASATTQELLARRPSDGQVIFNHAQNVFWVGEIAHQRGEIAKAEASFQHYRRLAERLIAIDPANDDWRAEVGYAESALGILFFQQGRVVEAVAAFERSLAVADGLARRHPDDPNLQLELGQSHAWLADALQRSGRLVEARAHRDTELEIYASILEKDPTLRQAKYSTIVALQKLGDLAKIEDDEKGALADFRESAVQGDALLAGEHDNMDLAAVVAIGQIDFGESLLAAGQPDAALAAHQKADALLTAALAHDASVALWRDYRDRAALLRAEILSAGGHRSEALLIDQEVLARLETQRAVPNTEPFWLLERFRLQVGDDLAALGRPQDAHLQWAAVVDNLPGPAEKYQPELLKLLASAESRLGRTVEAQAVAKRLRELASPRQPPAKSTTSRATSDSPPSLWTTTNCPSR